MENKGAGKIKKPRRTDSTPCPRHGPHHTSGKCRNSPFKKRDPSRTAKEGSKAILVVHMGTEDIREQETTLTTPKLVESSTWDRHLLAFLLEISKEVHLVKEISSKEVQLRTFCHRER
eukprot:14493661-Ditylum_brightwellii.AAC.1